MAQWWLIWEYLKLCFFGFTLLPLEIWPFSLPSATPYHPGPLPQFLPLRRKETGEGERGGIGIIKKKRGKVNPLQPNSQPPSRSLLLITRSAFSALQSFSPQAQPPISSFFLSHLTLSTNPVASEAADLLHWHPGAQLHPGQLSCISTKHREEEFSCEEGRRSQHRNGQYNWGTKLGPLPPFPQLFPWKTHSEFQIITNF